jgi:hypothetical protein
MLQREIRLLAMLALSYAAAAPLARADTATTAPTTGPTPVQWENVPNGVQIHYPGDWTPKKDPDYELMLLPPASSPADRRITIDIPDLPPHLPFMIQMGSVSRGYIDDLRKEHADLYIDEQKDISMPDAKAKLIRSSWTRDKIIHRDVALLIIHASAVYIIDSQCDDAATAATRCTFDSIVGSIRWVKH